MAIIANLERHIGDMYQSTSWKFAKPVRLASTLVRNPRAVARRLAGRSVPTEITAAPPPPSDGRDERDGPTPAPPTIAAATPAPDLSSAAADLERRLLGSIDEDRR
jgi:hypothetical protein